MEATALGCHLVVPTSSLPQHFWDSSSSPSLSGGRQQVKWGSPIKQLSFRSSNCARVEILPFARKAEIYRLGKKTSRSRRGVVSAMSKRDEQSSIISNNASLGRKEESLSLMTKFSKAVSCFSAAGVIFFHSGLPVWGAELRVTFPGSRINEVNTVQHTLVEAWGIIRETYVDDSFNHQDWDLMLTDSLADTLSMTQSEEAYTRVRTMLASLGDPFTRIITPKEYEDFRINNDGAVEGVGLLIASERDTGRLIVMNPIEGGPAARAGIITGDELVQIDDQVLTGLNGDEVATKLRGRAGTSVTLVLRRSITQVGAPNGESILFKLRRETISLSPVYSTVLPHSAPDGHLSKTGYIRLAAFSQNAAFEVGRAIGLLKNKGVGSYILDLRNNPGGLVKAGLDVAQMWLDGTEVLVNTVDREGYTQPITLVNGHALTTDPLVILVNGGSASASEILAGALHDNGRAVLVGERTYGKGRIQSVTQLDDGSALFVTVAKYLSPALHQIDHVGIRRLQRDSCILVAEHELDKSIST